MSFGAQDNLAQNLGPEVNQSDIKQNTTLMPSNKDFNLLVLEINISNHLKTAGIRISH
jgi:hypothetical protein